MKTVKSLLLITSLSIAALGTASAGEGGFSYDNYTNQAKTIVNKMTLEEKVGQMLFRHTMFWCGQITPTHPQLVQPPGQAPTTSNL